jgi:hypothetical protein
VNPFRAPPVWLLLAAAGCQGLVFLLCPGLWATYQTTSGCISLMLSVAAGCVVARFVYALVAHFMGPTEAPWYGSPGGLLFLVVALGAATVLATFMFAGVGFTKQLPLVPLALQIAAVALVVTILIELPNQTADEEVSDPDDNR